MSVVTGEKDWTSVSLWVDSPLEKQNQDLQRVADIGFQVRRSNLEPLVLTDKTIEILVVYHIKKGDRHIREVVSFSKATPEEELAEQKKNTKRLQRRGYKLEQIIQYEGEPRFTHLIYVLRRE